MAAALHVLLNDMPVGRLTLDERDGTEFRLLESYKQDYPRPVLGQIFLDDLDAVQRTRTRVPPWFSNLLPEGPLRELVAKQANVHTSREFFLLNHLGEDLPGAVRLVADPTAATESSLEEAAQASEGEVENGEAWHFSLAGVQLKFSARQSERGLTIPASGRGGDWIVKLPDARFPDVPANEYATMGWARASGIRVPEMELVETKAITGLPAAYSTYREPYALAVRRFDRSNMAQRVHMEDFAQILSLYPEDKYKKYNYEALARLMLALAGEAGLEEFIARLVFVIASGNGDAHHKNWSLLYPDGIHAELSPAYDLVSTILYQPEDKLALKLGNSKRWEDVDADTFRRLARKIGAHEATLLFRVEKTVADILDAWRLAGRDFGFDAPSRQRLQQHLARIPLFRAGLNRTT